MDSAGIEMIQKIVIVLGMSCLNALFYRLGGYGKPFNTRYRDVGCSLVILATCLILGLFTSFTAYLITFGLSWGAYASYWKSGSDMKFRHWCFHGVGIALALLPIAYITGNWLGFGLRLFILPPLIAGWSGIIGEVNLEEGGRGFLIVATLPLLLI